LTADRQGNKKLRGNQAVRENYPGWSEQIGRIDRIITSCTMIKSWKRGKNVEYSASIEIAKSREPSGICRDISQNLARNL
jgi:hypothetical protein